MVLKLCSYFSSVKLTPCLIRRASISMIEKSFNGFPDLGDVRARQARERLSRRILTTIWSSFISFLNSSLKTDNGSSQTGQGAGTHLILAAKLTKLSAQEQQLNEEGIRYFYFTIPTVLSFQTNLVLWCPPIQDKTLSNNKLPSIFKWKLCYWYKYTPSSLL